MTGAMGYDLERPIRDPDLASPPLMTKRARWLIVLGFLVPGSAQVLAGNRKLGRFGLVVTMCVWAVGLVAIAGLLFARSATLSILTNGFFLLVAQWIIIALAVVWLVLGFDTLRLLKIVKVKRNWRVPVAMLSILLTVLPVAGAAWMSTIVGSGRAAISDLFPQAPPVAPVDGRYNILLLGTDAGADREGMRPDSISLISVNAKTGQSMIIGLPRELVNMPFPETSPMYQIHPYGYGVAPNAFGDWGGCNIGDAMFCRLNALNTEMSEFTTDDGTQIYGDALYPDAVSRGSTPGIEATKDAVEGATGLEVQFFVLINMDGFAGLIDALGGVDINVSEELPIGGQIDEYTGELVNVEEWMSAGPQHLDGYHALWYARSRYGSVNGDYDRMARQRELQAAILAQIKPDVVLLRFQEILKAGTYLVETDIPDSMVGRFVDLATKARGYTPVNVELVPPAIIVEDPDYSLVYQMVQEGVAASSPVEEEEQ